MDTPTLMARAAAAFAARLEAEPGCQTLPAPDTGPAAADRRWDNLLLSARKFRRAHVETFAVPGRVNVLHVCVFPHLDDPAPILGFDMIAGPARVSGIFLDLSPVTAAPPAPRLRDIPGAAAPEGFLTRRALPDWGDIFSPDMLAVRPADEGEVRRAIGLAENALEAVLAAPFHALEGGARSQEIAAGQDRYCAAQRRNEHTLRMLTGFIGHGPARRFIDEVLFPFAPAA